MNVLNRKSIREFIDSGVVQTDGSVEGLPSLIRQHHQLRPAVMWIGGAVGVVQKPVMPSVVQQLVKYLAARRVGMFAVVPSQMTVFAGS